MKAVTGLPVPLPQRQPVPEQRPAQASNQAWLHDLERAWLQQWPAAPALQPAVAEAGRPQPTPPRWPTQPLPDSVQLDPASPRPLGATARESTAHHPATTPAQQPAHDSTSAGADGSRPAAAAPASHAANGTSAANGQALTLRQPSLQGELGQAGPGSTEAKAATPTTPTAAHQAPTSLLSWPEPLRGPVQDEGHAGKSASVPVSRPSVPLQEPTATHLHLREQEPGTVLAALRDAGLGAEASAQAAQALARAFMQAGYARAQVFVNGSRHTEGFALNTAPLSGAPSTLGESPTHAVDLNPLPTVFKEHHHGH
jgi:hypothetical protein